MLPGKILLTLRQGTLAAIAPFLILALAVASGCGFRTASSPTQTPPSQTELPPIAQEEPRYELWVAFDWGGDSLFFSVTNPATGKKDFYSLGPLLDRHKNQPYISQVFSASPGDAVFISLQGDTARSWTNARLAIRRASAPDPPSHWRVLEWSSFGAPVPLGSLTLTAGSDEWNRLLKFFEAPPPKAPPEWYIWHGVTPGMTLAEVRALWGEPLEKGRSIEDGIPYWKYSDACIDFDEHTGRVLAIDPAEKESVGGIAKGSSYQDLIRLWGEPSEILPGRHDPEAGFLASYRKGTHRVNFFVYQGKIAWITFGSPLAD